MMAAMAAVSVAAVAVAGGCPLTHNESMSVGVHQDVET